MIVFFMDAGSSTIEMIPFIKAQDIVVVTNGLSHVERLLHRGIKTLMIGEVKLPLLLLSEQVPLKF